MGSSQKKKKEKQKDFQVGVCLVLLLVIGLTGSQKTKLKVGKAKPKPSNFTDTSFKSKCTNISRAVRYFRYLYRISSYCPKPAIPFNRRSVECAAVLPLPIPFGF